MTMLDNLLQHGLMWLQRSRRKLATCGVGIVACVLAWFVAVASGRNAATGWVVASYVALLAGAIEFSAQMGAGTYAYGGPTDALWMLSFLLVGVAALWLPKSQEQRVAGEQAFNG